MSRHLSIPPSPPATSAAWRFLVAGVPLTLLLDLARASRLDSKALLRQEAVAELAAAEWAETAAQAH